MWEILNQSWRRREIVWVCDNKKRSSEKIYRFRFWSYKRHHRQLNRCRFESSLNNSQSLRFNSSKLKTLASFLSLFDSIQFSSIQFNLVHWCIFFSQFMNYESWKKILSYLLFFVFWQWWECYCSCFNQFVSLIDFFDWKCVDFRFLFYLFF